MLLDNPAWNSITTKHKHLGVIGKKAAISDPNVAWVGAINEETAEAYSELASIATPSIPVLIVGTNVPEGLAEWNILQRLKVQQMICTKPVTYKPIAYDALTLADIPSMMKLVELTKPGPFSSRALEIGNYIGIKIGGELVAMGGERLKPEGYVELCTICAHPEHRGKGYAKAIVGILTNMILEQGEVPFLHVSIQNNPAIKLYEKLGYTKRKLVSGTVMMLKSTSSN